MRVSIVFFAAFLGSAAAGRASENYERDLEEILERDLSGNAGPDLEERTLFGIGRPKPPARTRIRRPTSTRHRPRDVEERDLEERVYAGKQRIKLPKNRKGLIHPKSKSSRLGKGRARNPDA